MAEHRVTFRMPPVLLLGTPIVLACIGVPLLWLAATQHSAPAGSAGLALSVLGLWTLVANAVLQVQVGPAGIRIRSLRSRSRLVRWAEVHAITVEPERRGRRVTLWTRAGERIRLPLPMAHQAYYETAFLDGYHQIGQCWQAIGAPAGF